jgi:hypothetical protein
MDKTTPLYALVERNLRNEDLAYSLDGFPSFDKLSDSEKRALTALFLKKCSSAVLSILQGFFKKKYIVFYVKDNDEYFINCYTRGLKENFGHPELQIVMPIDQSTSSVMIDDTLNVIKKNGPIVTGRQYSEILRGYNVVFTDAEAMSFGQMIPVLRMILPGIDGELVKSKMKKPYVDQWP